MSRCDPSNSPLVQLSKHLAPSTASPSATSSFSPSHLATPSFRHDGNIKGKQRGDGEWNQFLNEGNRYQSQIEALPPPPPSSSYRSSSIGKQESYIDDNYVRPHAWSPEALNRLCSPSTMNRQSSSSSSASCFSYTPSTSTPTEEEAYSSISSTPSSYFTSRPSHSLLPHASSSSAQRHQHNQETPPSTESTPHPLTFDPASHAAWDFEKLFGPHRRWFGGIRVPNEELDRREEDMLTSAAVEAGSTSSRTAMSKEGDETRGRQKAKERGRGATTMPSLGTKRSQSLLRNEVVVGCTSREGDSIEERDEAAARARQKVVFDQLSRTAKARLNLIGSHFEPTIPMSVDRIDR